MADSAKAQFKRILIKVSGEALMGSLPSGIDSKILNYLAEEIKKGRDLGVEIAIVVGGGNIFRGRDASEKGINRITADYMGMLATVMNALALQDILEIKGLPTRVQTAIEMRAIAEPYIRRKAIRHLEKGRVVVLAAGTGNPYFTTDTAAALRAAEIRAEAILKATKVDGVYESDPIINQSALRFDHLDYLEVLNRGLKVMDSAAVSLCMDNNIPIVVFNIYQADNLVRILTGEKVGTLVGREKNE
ncbi:MAG: uridylate kinase [Candidatus Atribacteria bacterium]|nr:uridylate kinase [Candidatus Atribacteria bacterium]